MDVGLVEGMIAATTPNGSAISTTFLASSRPTTPTVVEVDLGVDAEGVAIEAAVETTAQTGVEMEALTAVSIAALTVYDMAKAIDKGMQIDEIVLVSKTKTPERA